MKKKYVVVGVNPPSKPIEVDSIEKVAEEVMFLIGKPDDDGKPDNQIPLREGWKDVWDY